MGPEGSADRASGELVGKHCGVQSATQAPSTGGRWGFAHVPALDGLRGAAVGAVLIYHLGHLDGGYLGVDLFFVLSGFLITSLLLAENAGNGRVALGEFWSRRARRLMPALLVLLVGVAAYAQWVARPVDLGAMRSDALATLAYVANWHFILQGTSYWDISLAPSPLQHTWSLAIEEQFYVLWPLVVVGLFSWARKRERSAELTVARFAGWGALISAAWLVTLHLWGASDTRVYQGTDTRAAALLIGAALAAWHRMRPVGESKLDRYAKPIGWVAGVVLAASWIWFSGTSPWLYRGGLAAVSLLAAIVVWAVVRGGGPAASLLSIAPLRWLGLISYGLYLWHWPIYQWIDARNGRLPFLGDRVVSGVALVLLKLAVSFAISILSYVVIEQPIRHSKLRGRPLLATSLSSMAVVAVLIVVSTTGAVSVPGQITSVNNPTVEVVGAPRVLYVGDSVSLSLVEPVVKDPKAFGINPINRGLPGCSIVAQGRESRNFAGQAISPPRCFPGLDDELVNFRPDVVFLMQGSRPNDQVKIDGKWVGACAPEWNEAFRTSVHDFVSRLQAAEVPVVIGTVARTSVNNIIHIPDSDQRIACANAQLKSVVDELPGTHLLDMDEFVCPDPSAPCREEIDGDEIRPDGLHYGKGPAGLAVADWVVGQVLERADLKRSVAD